MKRLIKKGFLLVALLAAITVSYANQVLHNPSEDAKTRLTFKNVNSGAVLKIIDINGLILYKEAIKESGNYSEEFDLTGLPNGNYYFQLNKSVEIIEIPFTVSDKIVTFDKESKKKIFKPLVYVNKNKMHVSKLSFEEESMEITIYYQNSDKVLYDNNMDRKGTILGKMYDFKGSEKGIYTIVIETGGREFVNTVKI